MSTDQGQDDPSSNAEQARVRRPIALIVGAGKEPDPYLTELDAQGSWAAVSSLWHPAILARSDELPTIVDVYEAGSPEPGQLVLVADGSQDRLPSGYRTQAEDCGAIIVDGSPHRETSVQQMLMRLDLEPGPNTDEHHAVADDFLALGTAKWWLDDLTRAMNHADCVDLESLTRETLAGAKAWLAGDPATATNRLRAAFELLTQARERFYPVDSYLVTIALLDPTTRPYALDETLKAHLPATILAPAQAIENLARRDSDRMEAVRQGIREGWLDVAGGSYTEFDEALAPLPSILWQYHQALRTYRQHLDDRSVETWARRRFGLHTQVPQLAKRFGMRFGLPMGFDAGKFPLRSEVKRLWESPDGSTLECLYRPPISGEEAVEAVRLPWRIGLTMKDDHSATVPIIHWASSVADWFRDLRRVASYSPVLSRMVTMNDYFHLTDRPFEGVRPTPDDYQTPYLDQAVLRGDDRPISARMLHWAHRARLEAAETVRSMAAALTENSVDPESWDSTPARREELLETGHWDNVSHELQAGLPYWAASLSRSILGDPRPESIPGYLVINPLGIPRRAVVRLVDAAPDLKIEGPLRAVQLIEDGVWAVVELPAFGYAWIPREPVPGGGGIEPGEVMLRDNRLRNGSIELAVDPSTGGMRGVSAATEQTARLGQQLVVLGLRDVHGAPATSKMVVDRIEPDYSGPALAQTTTYGRLVDGGGLHIADFEQRFRVWAGRPVAELNIYLSNIETDWFEHLNHTDPWTHGIACRWAWPDRDAMLRRFEFGHPWETVTERIETAEGIDLSTRRQRTAILTGGIAHHVRHSGRMMDSLLVVGKEKERQFRFAIALDLEHPFQAVQEWMSDAVVVATDAGPPKSGPTGWLFSLDQKSVMANSVQFSDHSAEGRGWGIAMILTETGGRSSRCKIRCFRNPISARQLDFNDEVIVDLSVEEDAVMVDLTPHEVARIDITLG